MVQKCRLLKHRPSVGTASAIIFICLEVLAAGVYVYRIKIVCMCVPVYANMPPHLIHAHTANICTVIALPAITPITPLRLVPNVSHTYHIYIYIYAIIIIPLYFLYAEPIAPVGGSVHYALCIWVRIASILLYINAYLCTRVHIYIHTLIYTCIYWPLACLYTCKCAAP